MIEISGELTGTSPAIRALQADIEVAAACDAKVLITGDTGTGKEVTARQIHARSQRRARPFVAINCAGIPETLLESELFGHARGSFTGACRDRIGLLANADLGTVFLDEVGEMSLRMQALLLRFLETGEIQRVGREGGGSCVDVRIIAATNRDLLQRVAIKAFRLDLFYRLNVLHLRTPALRDHPEDIPALFDHFLCQYSQQYRMPIPRLTSDAFCDLSRWEWAGNVRELKNVAERLVVRGYDRPVTVADLPRGVGHARTVIARAAARGSNRTWAQLFDRLVAGRECFWTAVYDPFMARDLTRDDLRALIRRGLEETRGSYKLLMPLFNIEARHHRRLLNALRKHDCLIGFHQVRQGSSPPS
jgi:two-component system nitrogen regulation response regulator NtrX